MNKKVLIFILTLLFSTFNVFAALPNDPMDPIANGKNANTGPLSGALIVTRNLGEIRRAYVEGLGLTLEGPLTFDPATHEAQRKLWQMPADLNWEVYTLTRSAVADAARILVIIPNRDTPVIRRSYEREETGPYALGFPMQDVDAVDARVMALGFKRTLPSVNRYPLQLRDGTAYPITEASYEMSDNNRLVILSRGNGLPQNGTLDAATGLGGPAYSSLIVEDAAIMEFFFTEVLDYERRTSREWTIFKPRFKYLTLHAKGARTGNLGLVEYALEDRKNSTGIAPRPPNRGLGGWSFEVKRLDWTLRRAHAKKITIISMPLKINDPRFGLVRMATVLAPNGLLVELYER